MVSPEQIRQAQVRSAEDLVIADLKARGLVTEAEIPNRAPRVTPADIEAEIASEHYFTAEEGVIGASIVAEHDSAAENTPEVLGLLTFCVLVLKNGFTVTGESACASPENFDADVGKRIARQKAVEKVWPLLGFRLRDRLHAQNQAFAPDV